MPSSYHERMARAQRELERINKSLRENNVDVKDFAYPDRKPPSREARHLPSIDAVIAAPVPRPAGTTMGAKNTPKHLPVRSFSPIQREAMRLAFDLEEMKREQLKSKVKGKEKEDIQKPVDLGKEGDKET